MSLENGFFCLLLEKHIVLFHTVPNIRRRCDLFSP